MNVYLDSSVVLRRLLCEPGALSGWAGWRLAVSSELMWVEVHRVLHRLRLTGMLIHSEVARLQVLFHEMTAAVVKVPPASAVLQRASAPLPTVIGALDAIHLATALLWMEDNDERLVFLTHDRQLALAAQACGLPVKP